MLNNTRFIPDIDSNRCSKNIVEYDRFTVRLLKKKPDIKANVNFYHILLLNQYLNNIVFLLELFICS